MQDGIYNAQTITIQTKKQVCTSSFKFFNSSDPHPFLFEKHFISSVLFWLCRSKDVHILSNRSRDFFHLRRFTCLIIF